MAEITLFHGTSSVSLKHITKNKGLNSPYLTDSEEVAEYYAECSVDDCGGEMVVLKVTVDIDKLRIDDNSYAEPLTFFRNDFTKSDAEWGQMLSNGEIPYPSNEKDWECSLSVVRSVRVKGFVPAVDIRIDYYPNIDSIDEQGFVF